MNLACHPQACVTVIMSVDTDPQMSRGSYQVTLGQQAYLRTVANMVALKRGGGRADASAVLRSIIDRTMVEFPAEAMMADDELLEALMSGGQAPAKKRRGRKKE